MLVAMLLILCGVIYDVHGQGTAAIAYWVVGGITGLFYVYIEAMQALL